jgi:hypothetical protein
MTAKPKPKVAPTYKDDKDYIKKQINLLVKLTNKPGVNGQKEREIWSQIDNLRSALGTINNAKRKSQVRGNGYMTLPSGKKITVVKGVMMNDNEARAALNPGGPGAAMPKKPEPKTPTTPKTQPWATQGPDRNWRVTPSGAAELERAGVRQTRRPTPRGGNPRGR